MTCSEMLPNVAKGPRKVPIQTKTEIKRILLVDDHPIVRQGLAQMINSQEDIRVCGEAENVDDAMALIGKSHPHLAVVDLALRDSSGLDLIGRISQGYPDLRVLVLSMHQDSFHAERAMRAGVKGFVGKDESPESVLAAMRTILAGGFHFGSQLTEKLVGTLVMDRHRQGDLLSIQRLSQRELQVFELVGLGNSTRVIAQKLNLSIKTVETYRGKIKEKLDLQDATQLLQRALQWTQYARQELLAPFSSPSVAAGENPQNKV